MNDEATKIWMALQIRSQASWRTPERARLLLEVFQADVFGKMSVYRVNDGRQRTIKWFRPELLVQQLESGRLEFLETEGMDVVPVRLFLSVDDAEWDDMVQRMVGMSLFSASRRLGALRERHPLHDMTPWLTMLECLAEPLDILYGGIREHGFMEPKLDEFVGRPIMPSHCRYTERVMLFGPLERERFGADYLRAAPVHEVRELENGAIVLITSPDSLDASVREDEALFDRVYHYLMAHPNAGKFM